MQEADSPTPTYQPGNDSSGTHPLAINTEDGASRALESSASSDNTLVSVESVYCRNPRDIIVSVPMVSLKKLRKQIRLRP